MNGEEGSRKPEDTAFKQQRLPAWQPILTCRTVVPTLFAVGVVFCVIGGVLLAASESVVESTPLRYDNLNNCPLQGSNSSTPCTLDLVVPQDMPKPVYMYYQLTNFYQNHRRYVKSRNDVQLSGEVVTNYADLEDCEPLRTRDGQESNQPQNFYYPCGLVANSLFTDVFENLVLDGTSIPLTKKGIAWPSDVQSKFKNNPSAPGLNPPDLGYRPNFEDEDFIVWMRTAGLPKFRKLYRIINQDLKKGTYKINVHNKYNVKDFAGTKTIILSTTSWIGGKNPFLGTAYIIVGGLCVIFGIIFAVYDKFKFRPLGDPQYIVWNQSLNSSKNQ